MLKREEYIRKENQNKGRDLGKATKDTNGAVNKIRISSKI